MQTAELQPEIVSLQKQLDSLWGKFDEAIKCNAEMLEIKKIYQEIKLIKERIDKLKIEVANS
jgi:peptidoglycan hydrolase CwlO-like protein